MSFVKESRSIVFQTGRQNTVVLGEKFIPNKTQKEGTSKNYSCSVSRKGLPQASGFENTLFHFIMLKSQFKGMHKTRSPWYIRSLS